MGGFGSFFDAVVWWFGPAPVFVVRMRKGELHVPRGKVTREFLDGVRDILNDHSVTNGTVWGYRRRGIITLGFSRSIPAEARQQLRNIWVSR